MLSQEGSSLSLLSPFHAQLFLPTDGPEALQRPQAHNNQGDQQPSTEFLSSSHYCIRGDPHSKSHVVVLLVWQNPSDTASLWQFPGENLVLVMYWSISCFSEFSNSLLSRLLCLSSCLCPESIKMQSMGTCLHLPQTLLTKTGNFIKILWLKMRIALKQNTYSRWLKTAYFSFLFWKVQRPGPLPTASFLFLLLSSLCLSNLQFPPCFWQLNIPFTKMCGTIQLSHCLVLDHAIVCFPFHNQRAHQRKADFSWRGSLLLACAPCAPASVWWTLLH